MWTTLASLARSFRPLAAQPAFTVPVWARTLRRESSSSRRSLRSRLGKVFPCGGLNKAAVFLSPESPGGSIAASPPTAMQELAIKLFRRHIEDCETLLGYISQRQNARSNV